MISETYKKNISVFIFNENIYMARAIKDRLAASEYDVHFYTDENLVRQSVYLALPHIVILPSTQRFEKLLMDIRKMSREIQIFAILSWGTLSIKNPTCSKCSEIFSLDVSDHLKEKSSLTKIYFVSPIWCH